MLALLLALAFAACSGSEQGTSLEPPDLDPIDEPRGTDEPIDGQIGLADPDGDSADPIVLRVGETALRFSDYLEFYTAYEPYSMYIEDFPGFIRTEMENYAIQLEQCEQLGIRLDEEEEAELYSSVDEDIRAQVMTIYVDGEENMSPEEAYEQKLRVLTERLVAAGYPDFDSYRQECLDGKQHSMMIDKLRAMTNEDVTVSAQELQAYFDENSAAQRESFENDPSAFYGAYNNYITGFGAIPLYTPANMFTVKHCLVQFTNSMIVSDGVEGVFEGAQQEKLDAIRTALEYGVSLDEFITRFVSSGDYNSDGVFVPSEGESDDLADNPRLGYRAHGYIMNEALLDRYFDGFGAAACLLHYGSGWRDPADGADPVEKYGVRIHTTTDGTAIAEVQTNVANGGVHFIWIAEELTAGTAAFDPNDPESEVCRSIGDAVLQAKQEEHYTEALEQWKADADIFFDEALITSWLNGEWSPDGAQNRDDGSPDRK